MTPPDHSKSGGDAITLGLRLIERQMCSACVQTCPAKNHPRTTTSGKLCTALSTPLSTHRASLRVIFFTVFLDLLSFGIVIPLLPRYAVRMHASDIETGVLLAIYSFMQLFFAPFWGRLSDRKGRRPVLLISIFGSFISQIGYAFAPSFTFLLLARALAGVCGANISAAQAYVADVTDSKSRAAGMGILGAAFGLGFVFGPAIGGLLTHPLDQVGFLPGFLTRIEADRIPFLFAGFLSLTNLVLAYFFLGEPVRKISTASREERWQLIGRALAHPQLRTLIIMFGIVTFGFANLEGTFSLYLQRRFGFGLAETSYLFTFIGVVMVIVQGGLVRRLVPMLGERRLVVIGTLAMALGFGMLFFVTHLGTLLVAVGIIAIGNGLNTPSLSALISQCADADRQGSVLGVSQSAGALARILGPIAGTAVLVLGPAMPYVSGGLVLLIAGLYAYAKIMRPGTT